MKDGPLLLSGERRQFGVAGLLGQDVFKQCLRLAARIIQEAGLDSQHRVGRELRTVCVELSLLTSAPNHETTPVHGTFTQAPCDHCACHRPEALAPKRS